MTANWHADQVLLEAYANDATDDARAYSLEAHLVACEHCRSRLSAAVPLRDLERLWGDVALALDAPRVGFVERALLRLGVSEHVARLLAATPSLRISWMGAIAVALGFAVAAAHTGPNGLLAFLVVAPLGPLAGVAAAYGPRMNPTYEIGLAAPMRTFRLLLIRTAAVVATSVLLAGLASLALPNLDWTAAAWLLPSLGLTALSLALSTVWSPLRMFGAVAFGWVAVAVLGESLSRAGLPLFHANGQAAFLLLAIVGTAILVTRRESLDMRRRT